MAQIDLKMLEWLELIKLLLFSWKKSIDEVMLQQQHVRA